MGFEDRNPLEFMEFCKVTGRIDILLILFKLIEPDDGTIHRENLTVEDRMALWRFKQGVEDSVK